jgi:dynactin 1
MIGGHVAELRGSKAALNLDVILGFLSDITADVAAGVDIQPWDIIGMFITRLTNDVNDLLPKIRDAVEAGQLIKSLTIWRRACGNG